MTDFRSMIDAGNGALLINAGQTKSPRLPKGNAGFSVQSQAQSQAP
jgi:hypothetical protein